MSEGVECRGVSEGVECRGVSEGWSVGVCLKRGGV